MPKPHDSDESKPMLIDDVVLKVLTFCDIYTVLTASQASKRLHALAFSKSTWLALLSYLHQRSTIDLPPDERLDAYTTSGLIDLVKHIIQGPQSWLPTSAAHNPGPTLSHQIILKPEIQLGPGILFWENEPQLLPGGRFVVFQNSGKLECWSVALRELIWTYHSDMERYRVDTFTAETVDEGRRAVILIGIRVYEDGPRKNLIEVVNLDLVTGTSRSLLRKRAPDTSHDNPFYRFHVQGDYAIVGMHHTEWIMIIQISTTTKRTFNISNMYCDMDLIPGYLILSTLRTKSESSSVLDVRLWPIETLLEAPDGALIDSIAPLATEPIELNALNASVTFRLSAHLSPLRTDQSILWVLVSSLSPLLALVRKYHVSHYAGQRPTIRCVKAWERTDTVIYVPRDTSRISYAGYAETFWALKNYIYSLGPPNVESTVVRLLGRGDHMHMSAYSGALTYATHESVVVNYYA
ncbi:hypothetical protein Hypma_006030 [Hypsizygus marmoreus]|uniref:F-box domain-containing protein n=1 Tax=Hypsizygus marmoreus TaxID=39966 RepID=A0A369JYQ2_HYPMA|nr:hypothetical protein Hypma_006030 [Hypsizygus marmoreus]